MAIPSPPRFFKFLWQYRHTLQARNKANFGLFLGLFGQDSVNCRFHMMINFAILLDQEPRLGYFFEELSQFGCPDEVGDQRQHVGGHTDEVGHLGEEQIAILS